MSLMESSILVINFPFLDTYLQGQVSHCCLSIGGFGRSEESQSVLRHEDSEQQIDTED